MTSSQEYRNATPTVSANYTRKCGLKDLNIDELFAKNDHGGKYEKICKAREVIDSDVKVFMKKPLRSEDMSVDFDIEFNDIVKSLAPSGSDRLHSVKAPFHQPSNDVRNEIKFPAPSFSNRQPVKAEADDPPKKIPAITASANPQPLKQSSNILNNINNVYQKRKLAATSVVMQAEPSSNKPELRNFFNRQVPARIEVAPAVNRYPDFSSARHEHQLQNVKNHGSIQPKSSAGYNPAQSTVGKRKAPVNGLFKSPASTAAPEPQRMEVDDGEEVDDHPLLKGIDPQLLEAIKRDVVTDTKPMAWSEIAGLKEAKQTLMEAVVLPLTRPDLFTGLRSAPKGILLFGPPGTGKSLIGKCIASQSKATFLSVSASTLTSKWIGQGEKLVKALFMYARAKQPTVIFLDEIDSILTKRSDNENDASRRLKTEFFLQLEGAYTMEEKDRILLVGATNRPQELDDAARRRFTKRLYIPLPDIQARHELISQLIMLNKNNLTDANVAEIAQSTEGFSGHDIKSLCADASFQPIRENPETIATIKISMVSMR